MKSGWGQCVVRKWLQQEEVQIRACVGQQDQGYNPGDQVTGIQEAAPISTMMKERPNKV